MPTILRFRNFRIEIFTQDHTPAHVHARGPNGHAIFFLNCWKGPVQLLESYELTSAVEDAIADFLNLHLELLCRAWETIHGDPTGA